jgi:hypothetical protein
MNKNAPLRTLVAASMMSVGALLLVGVLLYLAHPTPAQANSGDLNTALSQYPQLNNTRLNSCSLCHSSNIPSLNPYGAAYLSQGRSSAALKAIEALDSDGDGFTNVQEINALTFPGNANDKPAAAATATNPPLPTNTPTKTPTGIPTNAPTNIPTKAPTNTPTKAPTGLPPTSTPTQAPKPTNTPTVPAPSLTPTTPATTAPQPPYPPPATATSVPTSQPKPTQKPTSNPGSQTLALGPAADAYVTASQAKHNFGGEAELKVVNDPTTHSYLRFDVKGLDGKKVSKATLSLYVNSASGDGFDILRVGDGGWAEGNITYRNAPKVGSRIAGSGAAGGQWVTIDVTALFHGSGRYSLALVAHNGSSISIASRESGANAPQLKLTVGQRGGDDDHGGDDGGDHDD